ncbi:MAG: caspase family protein, partial [Nannocystaceae bacterium]
KARAARARDERVELLFYYSGHSDETGLLIGEKRVSYRWLREKIDALPADVRIAILDSCASGAFTRLKGGKKREPFLVREPSVKGHAFLTSTSADEAAQESERIRGSFFTHYLVTGLRGAADINQDHLVTLNEAYQFAFDETLARTEGTRGGPQHAAYEIQLAGSGDLVMTDLRTSTATIELAADIGGRVFIRDEQGNLEAELHKPKGAGTVALALEPGSYRITVDDGGNVWRASVQVAEGDAAVLEAKNLKVRPAEPTTLRGDAEPKDAPPAKPEFLVVPANMGVSPKYSTNAKYSPRPLLNRFSVSVGYNKVAAIEGLDMSLGATTVTDHLYGVQLAVGMANTEGRATGVQASGILSLATGDFSGHQWSTVVNVATKNLHGSQMGTGV